MHILRQYDDNLSITDSHHGTDRCDCRFLTSTTTRPGDLRECCQNNAGKVGVTKTFFFLLFFFSEADRAPCSSKTCTCPLLSRLLLLGMVQSRASKSKSPHDTCLWNSSYFILCHSKTSLRCYAGVQKDVLHAIKPFFLECETDHMAAWCESLITSDIGCRESLRENNPRPHHGQRKAELEKFGFFFAKSSAVKSKNGPLRYQNKDLEGRYGAVFC